MSFLAALVDHNRFVWLSEGGVWLPKSAFDGKTNRVRVFRYEESARGVAEDWAAKTVDMQPHVEAVR